MKEVFVVEKITVHPNLNLKWDRVELQGIYSSFESAQKEHPEFTFEWHEEGYWASQSFAIRDTFVRFTVTIWPIYP